jgi:ribosomal protein S18 acetylase RimI-like enzyme
VPYAGWVIRQQAGGSMLAAGQYAREAELMGLYDVGVAAGHQRQGLAQRLCEWLLALAAAAGASQAYLQVGADNSVARRLYARVGFVDAYSYHYRAAPTAPVPAPSPSPAKP